MDHLRCVVERITYQNAENGYSVLRLRAKGFTDLITAVGNMADTHIGSVLSLNRTGCRFYPARSHYGEGSRHNGGGRYLYRIFHCRYHGGNATKRVYDPRKQSCCHQRHAARCGGFHSVGKRIITSKAKKQMTDSRRRKEKD